MDGENTGGAWMPGLREAEIAPGDGLRARVHFLVAQNNALIVQTQFADAKAAALMALMGIIALRGPVPLNPGPEDPLGLAMAAMIVVSVLACFWAVIPRYPGAKMRRRLLSVERFSWPALASDDCTGAAHGAFAREGAFGEIIGALAHANVSHAQVLLKKFRAMRVAFVAAMAAVALLILRIALVPG